MILNYWIGMNLRHFGVRIHALHIVVVFKQIHKFMNLLQLRTSLLTGATISGN